LAEEADARMRAHHVLAYAVLDHPIGERDGRAIGLGLDVGLPALEHAARLVTGIDDHVDERIERVAAADAIEIERAHAPCVFFSTVAFTFAWHFGHSTVRVCPREREPVITQPRSHALLSA